MADVEKKIRGLLESPMRESGFELLDVQCEQEGVQKRLSLYIDHPQGVQIEDCVQMNHLCGPLLDQADFLPENYTLEVSSPGIFRPLTKPEHFERYVGERVKVLLSQPVKELKKIEGHLLNTTAEGILLKIKQGKAPLFIPYHIILKSNLEPQLRF